MMQLCAPDCGSWRRNDAGSAIGDMAMFGLRLGDQPQAMVTTTPKPISIIRELINDGRNVVTRGTTWDNRAHLANSFFDQVVGKYQGTRLGRQELYAEILEEAEGALWTREMIRRGEAPPFIRVVVGVDPPASSSGGSALAGIVVCGLGVDRRGYVLADHSGRMSPGEWGRKVVEAYDTFNADRIVAEGNQGGEMVRHTIQTVRENAPVTIVHASRGKQARAEPVAALYEQGKVDHVGTFPALEDEMCTWEPLSAMPSPDRLDAMVWAMTDLAIGGGPMVYAQTVEEVVCDPISIPSIWPQVCVLDIGRTHFGALWGAWHRTPDTVYLTGEYLAHPGFRARIARNCLTFSTYAGKGNIGFTDCLSLPSPNIRVRVVTSIAGNDDMIAAEWLMTGTNRGPIEAPTSSIPAIPASLGLSETLSKRDRQ
jgi:hypothetical protein